ncbi:MAG: hypothetical protein CM15mP40_10900 [Alphaproteobacteria bacterium]|nr:MAG: hypothetical protein CM15mP40_10900 [Alphaproteobacteria bacterium]
MSRGYKKRMVKKIKIEAIIEIKDESHIDDVLLKRTMRPIGEIESCKIFTDLSNNSNDEQKANSLSLDKNISEVEHFINDANKIYFGTLSIEDRKYVAASILKSSSRSSLQDNANFKDKLIQTLTKKFEIDSEYAISLLEQEKDPDALETLKSKFLEGDLIQMFTFIWEKILSVGEEDDFEIDLIENSAEKFGLEKQSLNDTKKIGNERAKIIKAISVIEAGKVAYNKLKAFEKTVLLSLMLTECSRIDGKISSDDLALLKNIFSDQFNISSNVMTAVIEKKLNYSITKKVEQVEVYREKYELVEFLWEKILSSESEINDNEMTLIRKWVRRLDISDVESEGARKEVEANLNP